MSCWTAAGGGPPGGDFERALAADPRSIAESIPTTTKSRNFIGSSGLSQGYDGVDTECKPALLQN
jgi:hypothetical protein